MQHSSRVGLGRQIVRVMAACAVAMLMGAGFSTVAAAEDAADAASIVSNQGGVIGAGYPTSLGTPVDGTGQMIVVIDGAFNPTHPMLAGRVKEEACFGIYAPVLDDKDSTCSSGSAVWEADPNIRFESGVGTSRYDTDCLHADGTVCNVFHGTAVASYAAGNKVAVGGEVGTVSGIAPGASLALLKVGNKAGWGKLESTAAALTYVRDVLAKKYTIAAVNISNSGGINLVPDGATCPTNAVTVLASELNDKGIAVVVAAGNDSAASAVGPWACGAGVLAVGSTNVTDMNTLVQGTYGSNASKTVKLLAPVGATEEGGEANGVWAAHSYRTATSGAKYENNYGKHTGTSFAAPQVAGAFAVLRQRFPTKTVAELTGLLQRTGVNVADTRAGTAGVVTPRMWLANAAGDRDRPVWDYTGDGRTDTPLLAADGRSLMLFPISDRGQATSPSVLVSGTWTGHTVTVPVTDYRAANTNGFIATVANGTKADVKYYAYDKNTKTLDAGTLIRSDVGSNIMGATFVHHLPIVGTGTGIILQRDTGALELLTRDDGSSALSPVTGMLPADASSHSKLVGVADLNLDGQPDLVVRDATTGMPRAYYGTGIPTAPFTKTATNLTTTSYWTGREQAAVVDGWTNTATSATPWAWYSVRPVNGNQVGFAINSATGTITNTSVTVGTWVPDVRLLHAARGD